MGEPIMEFKTQEEAYACLKEWQDRLFLNDWTIKVNLVDRKVLEKDGKEYAGYNDFQYVNQVSVIELAIPDDDVRDRMLKFSMEHTLIHELLHLKYNWLENDMTRHDTAYFEHKEHQLIEQMSKSLFMAKYNLTLDWFKNF